MDVRRALLLTFLGSLGLAAATGVVAILFDLPYWDKVVGTAALVAGYSVAALVCTAMIARRTQRMASWISLGFQGLSLAGWLSIVWFDNVWGWSRIEYVALASGSCTLLFLASMHYALLGWLTLTGFPGRLTRLGALVLVNAALLVVLSLMWSDELSTRDWAALVKALAFVSIIGAPLGVSAIVLIRLNRGWGRYLLLPTGAWIVAWAFAWLAMFDDEDILLRLFGGLLIAGLFCTFATPLLAYIEHMGRKRGHDASIDASILVELTCPKCAAAASVHANRREACRSCGLRLLVEFDEPRCSCGYLLYGLAADRCPECGVTIPQAMRWAALEERHEPPVDG